MEQWYRNSWNIVVKDLKSDIYKGLTTEEAELREKNYGSNEIKVESYNIYICIGKLLIQLWFLSSIANTYILFSEGYAAIGIISLMLTLIGFFGQVIINIRRYKDQTKIKKRNKFTVRVLRDGINTTIKSEELVLGDIVELKKGAFVPADIRIIECEKLFVLESSITGESGNVEKYSTKLDEEIGNIANIRNMVFRSSIVTEGEALGIVVAVGMNTVDSGIIKAMNKVSNEEDPMVIKGKEVMNTHTVLVLIIAILFSSVVFFLDKDKGSEILRIFKVVFFSGSFFNTVLSALLASVILKVHINNEEVQLLKATTALKLPRVGILVMEKFGVISEEHISPIEIYTDRNTYLNNIENTELSSNLNRILQALTLCNSYNEFLKNGEADHNYVIDKSLRLYVEKTLKYEIEEGKYKRLFVNPYDSESRIMTYVYKVEENYRAYCKGLMDSVMNRCTYIMVNGMEVEITKEDFEDIKQKAVSYESKGLHVIAVAYRNFTYEPTPVENIESNMVFVGLIVLKNPIREEAFKYITELRKNGIRPIIFTEDTKLSAFTWGKRLGVVKNINDVLSGVELDNMSQKEYEGYCSKIGIYSKLTPSNKTQIIKTYEGKGVSTAYICRGIEDLAPAVNSEYSIIQKDKPRSLNTLSNLLIKNDLLKNLLFTIKKVKLYMAQLGKGNEFILTYLTSQILLTMYISAANAKEVYGYSSFVWIGFFNLPIMLAIILIDNMSSEKEEIKLSLSDIKGIRVNLTEAYKKAAVLAAFSIAVQLLMKSYAGLTVNTYSIFNLLLIGTISIYRVKKVKLISLSNFIYVGIIFFNLALIFIMSK